MENLVINDVTLGTDVEFFLKDKQTGEIVSAEGLVKGTKNEPFRFNKRNKHFATSLDNVTYEGNIPPSKNATEYYNNIQKLLKYMNTSVPMNLETCAIGSARLDKKYLRTKNALTYGCEPSLNCWNEEVIYPQPSAEAVRAAGKHIHVGYSNPNRETSLLIGKAMDLYLGIPSVLMEPENERKATGYGGASNIRLKDYGLEYRSLSSYFASSKELIKWCFNNTKDAIKFVNKGFIDRLEGLGDDIQSIINQDDKKGALELIKQFKIELL